MGLFERKDSFYDEAKQIIRNAHRREVETDKKARDRSAVNNVLLRAKTAKEVIQKAKDIADEGRVSVFTSDLPGKKEVSMEFTFLGTIVLVMVVDTKDEFWSFDINI